MIASVLTLNRSDMKSLNITDDYSLHRIVFDLYEDIRSDIEKSSSISSGILYADKGGDWNSRQIIMLSSRPPTMPIYGILKSRPIPLSFLDYDHYAFEVVINPTKRDKSTGKIIPLRSKDEIISWFKNKSDKSWGFSVDTTRLQIKNTSVKKFDKKGRSVTLGAATIIGQLTVSDRAQFIKAFQQGIGRARAFGFGLLQIKPLIKDVFNQDEELK